MCIVAMCMGLRVSEVLGLKWCDIDWEGMRVGIRQSYVYGIPGAVKTPASQRWMPLDRSLAEELRQHQLRSASPVNTEGWIFANPATGKPYWPGCIQANWLVPAAERVGLGRIGWHTFRHSHSSLLHALGVDSRSSGNCCERRYSDDDEYLHACGSRRFERGKQQSGSSGAAGAGSVSSMLP